MCPDATKTCQVQAMDHILAVSITAEKQEKIANRYLTAALHFSATVSTGETTTIARYDLLCS
jgi:hypothetical protein